MREIKLMNRTYDDVLDRVTFQVLQAGFKKGYGADGDHLKSLEEVRYAIDCGYTMITLDCSEHIRGEAASMSGMELEALRPLPAALEQEYLGRSFQLTGDVSVQFTRTTLHQAYLIYGEAISFAKSIYDACIAGSSVELEISIDETETPTTPAQHFFAANELKKAGVVFKTMAPRFCGEFQKGIDYIGDLAQFDEEFKVHVAVADHFGYKISVHSGSDKFAVYPSVGRMTHGRFHVKTSGTSWLEALRLTAVGGTRALPRAVRLCHRRISGVARQLPCFPPSPSRSPISPAWRTRISPPCSIWPHRASSCISLTAKS